MRRYDLVLVLVPQEEKQTETLLGKIKKDLDGYGAKVEKEDAWGKKELAYRIRKYGEGIYHYFDLDIDPSKTNQLEQRLKHDESLLRYLLVKQEKIVAKKVVKPQVKAETKSEDKKEEVVKETKEVKTRKTRSKKSAE